MHVSLLESEENSVNMTNNFIVLTLWQRSQRVRMCSLYVLLRHILQSCPRRLLYGNSLLNSAPFHIGQAFYGEKLDLVWSRAKFVTQPIGKYFLLREQTQWSRSPSWYQAESEFASLLSRLSLPLALWCSGLGLSLHSTDGKLNCSGKWLTHSQTEIQPQRNALGPGASAAPIRCSVPKEAYHLELFPTVRHWRHRPPPRRPWPPLSFQLSPQREKL